MENQALDNQRAALAHARRLIIARYEQIQEWLRQDGVPEDTIANWSGMVEGLMQARRIIGGMWDSLPVPVQPALDSLAPQTP